MATDIIKSRRNTGQTVKFVYFSEDAQPYIATGSGAGTFENWTDAHIAQYGVSATEQGTSGQFVATTPTAVAALSGYYVEAYALAGASLALTDWFIGNGDTNAIANVSGGGGSSTVITEQAVSIT